MDKKKLFIGILISVFILGATSIVYLISQKSPTTDTGKLDKNALIYFYGTTCPHCTELSKYLTEQGIDKKVSYQKLEVYENKENQALLQEAVDVCKFDVSKGVGVPFIFDKGNCYVGTEEAKKIFNEKLQEASASGN
ncbi:MAG: hypothetical protein WC775_00225 [Patescibacteria group bacterium]|jgi:glutaredoxin